MSRCLLGIPSTPVVDRPHSVVVVAGILPYTSVLLSTFGTVFLRGGRGRATVRPIHEGGGSLSMPRATERSNAEGPVANGWMRLLELIPGYLISPSNSKIRASLKSSDTCSFLTLQTIG
jgi:hypothetical protein